MTKKYTKNDIFTRRILLNRHNPRNCYRVDIVTDSNYGYASTILKKELFESDELLLFVLSYLDSFKVEISWISDYLKKSLYFYNYNTSMSIIDIDIIYYDEQGISYTVILPVSDDLFDSDKEFVEYMDNLFENSIYL